jgi:rhodanese-related sulfurtransferase
MKYLVLLLLLLFNGTSLHAEENRLESYLTGFNYQERSSMKMASGELVYLLATGQAQLIDIRFKEEYAAWQVAPSLNVPLNELPQRLDELDRKKIVVTACPYNDRAIIAMTYLRSKGIQARYLSDGLLSLAQNLRGDQAKIFYDKIQQLKE